MQNLVSVDFIKGLVSVIVPCYNRETLVGETLDSVFWQIHRPIELIIVDDGSTDNSLQIIEQWAAQKGDLSDAGFRVQIIHQENEGPSKARNSGLSVCSGEFIQFLDSDDILHREKIAKQVLEIIESKKDFCVCNYQNFTKYIDEEGPIVDFFSRSHDIEDFPLEYPMNTPTPLYSRSVVALCGGWNPAIRASEDFEYNFRIICNGAKGAWLNCVLVYVRKHQSEERIQATPLRKRYICMHQGLVAMEKEARRKKIYTQKLDRNLGICALKYYEHMRAEQDACLGKLFLSYAIKRVPLWRIVVFFLEKRYWRALWKKIYPKGPRALMQRILA